MDVFETMKTRQSIRKFRKDPVPREHILRMAEAASWAPTAGNSQNFRFIAVQERETIDRMRESSTRSYRASPEPMSSGREGDLPEPVRLRPAVICVVGAPTNRRRTGRSARRTPIGTRRAVSM